jgi:hypothetical protein
MAAAAEVADARPLSVRTVQARALNRHRTRKPATWLLGADQFFSTDGYRELAHLK